MAKQNPNVTQEWCFVKNMWKAGSVKGLSFLLQFISSYTIKGIFSIKHCVIVPSTNYYVTDSHFIKSSILKPIIEYSNTREQINFGLKKKKQF